ncbi:hypothetical protein N9K70_02860 [Pseudomonadales bacterium]|nr:hypothetical protein [Pseudomonadales bacterium]
MLIGLADYAHQTAVPSCLDQAVVLPDPRTALWAASFNPLINAIFSGLVHYLPWIDQRCRRTHQHDVDSS